MTTNTTVRNSYAPRRVPKQARAKATVSAVLDASARVLVAVGYAKSNTNLIAETAGISVGSLYEYFPGKEAIYAELRRREGAKTSAIVFDEMPPQSPLAALDHLVSRYIARYRDDHALLVALENEVPTFAVADAEQVLFDEFVELSEGFLSAYEEHLKPEANKEFIAEFLFRTVCSMVVEYAKYSPAQLSNPQLANSIVDMIAGWMLVDAKG